MLVDPIVWFTIHHGWLELQADPNRYLWGVSHPMDRWTEPYAPSRADHGDVSGHIGDQRLVRFQKPHGPSEICDSPEELE